MISVSPRNPFIPNRPVSPTIASTSTPKPSKSIETITIRDTKHNEEETILHVHAYTEERPKKHFSYMACTELTILLSDSVELLVHSEDDDARIPIESSTYFLE